MSAIVLRALNGLALPLNLLRGSGGLVTAQAKAYTPISTSFNTNMKVAVRATAFEGVQVKGDLNKAIDQLFWYSLILIVLSMLLSSKMKWQGCGALVAMRQLRIHAAKVGLGVWICSICVWNIILHKRLHSFRAQVGPRPNAWKISFSKKGYGNFAFVVRFPTQAQTQPEIVELHDFHKTFEGFQLYNATFERVEDNWQISTPVVKAIPLQPGTIAFRHVVNVEVMFQVDAVFMVDTAAVQA